MSQYLPAVVAAAAGVLALALLVAYAAAQIRRFAALARAYRRQLAAESALLAHRADGLRAELARSRRRTPAATPRTIR